jgi:PAS domain S-box-containing protein
MAVDREDQPGPPADHQARLLFIIDTAMDAFITVDESQRVVMFNKAAEKMFGVPATEALWGPLERFIPKRSREVHAEHIRRFGRTGVTNRDMGHLGVIHGLRADGTEFPIEASISQATVDGHKFYTVIIRDISERLRLEQALQHAQKMESIGRLAGGVAHDFNNLLMAIFNYLALASRRLEASHPARGALAHVQEAADRAAALTRQLLAFARKQETKQRALCPREVVVNMEPMLRRLLGEQVQLRTALAPETGTVKADGPQLEQVIMNLAVNARDAMPRGGTITIETANVTLDEAYCRTRGGATPGEHVVISVTDTGEGMSPEVLSHLFEPFFTTKPPGKGTGLGLATSHGIIRQASGHIAVYSELGRGTSARVYLPRLTEAEAGGKETVLVVEDSALVRDLTAESLRGAGYTVLSAASSAEAIRASNAHGGTIDLLVTDVVLPDMNGVQLAKELTKERPEMRVIYMSGYTEETVEEHGVEPSRMPFLAKPFTMDLLLRMVREVLDSKASE